MKIDPLINILTTSTLLARREANLAQPVEGQSCQDGAPMFNRAGGSLIYQKILLDYGWRPQGLSN